MSSRFQAHLQQLSGERLREAARHELADLVNQHRVRLVNGLHELALRGQRERGGGGGAVDVGVREDAAVRLDQRGLDAARRHERVVNVAGGALGGVVEREEQVLGEALRRIPPAAPVTL